MSRITLSENTASGTLLRTYVVTPTSSIETGDSSGSSGDAKMRGRIDIIPSGAVKSTSQTSTAVGLGVDEPWLQYLLGPFLPVGYPDSVSPDYTGYQLYDSLQALFSTTASLLASRAVLTTLGVGSATATTTLALYLSILQSTISNLASILFAHHFSLRIAADVKFYRFFADIVNDIAFVLDVLSPSLPDSWLKVAVLCIGSACRAVCGVCGGASKAVLSSHFAVRGNIGEVNAKDGSQETVVNLVGMWVGGWVVGRVEGVKATWVMLVVLLMGHLWANWSAVRCVRLRTLNQTRAQMVVQRVVEGRDCGVDAVGREETFFVRGSKSFGSDARVSNWAFGGVEDLLDVAGWWRQAGGRAYRGDAALLSALLEVFGGENYLLWWNRRLRRCVIVLKTTSGSNDVGCDIYLKAMCHACIIASSVESDEEKASEVALLHQTLRLVGKRWPDCLTAIRRGGWDLKASGIEAAVGSRLHVEKN